VPTRCPSRACSRSSPPCSRWETGDLLNTTLVLKQSEWKTESDFYLSGLMLAYYLIHLDQPEHPGALLAGYFHLLERHKGEIDAFIVEYNSALNDYNEKRGVHDREVAAYKAALLRANNEVTEFNRRVNEHNDPLRRHVPPDQLIKVGNPPVLPIPPKPLQVPAILEENQNNRTSPDFESLLSEKSAVAIYRGRTPAEMEKALVEGFASIGIQVAPGAVSPFNRPPVLVPLRFLPPEMRR